MATACILARLNLQELVFRTLSQRAFAKKKKKKDGL